MSVIKIITIPIYKELIIGYSPLLSCGGLNKHELERYTVEWLVRELTGDKHETVGHYENGSPYLKNSQMNISISHGADMAVVALHPTMRIGVDIELPRTQLIKIRRKYLNDNEYVLIGTEIELLQKVWCSKEAVYKASGINGLALRDINTDPSFEMAFVDNGLRFKLCHFRVALALITLAIPDFTKVNITI